MPDIYFPPDGSMMIELERVSTKPEDTPYIYVEDRGDYEDGCNGFVVRTRGLAEEAFVSNGVQGSEVVFRATNGIFYGPVPSPPEVANATGITAPTGKFVEVTNSVDTSKIGHVFAHSNLQFNFDVTVQSMDEGPNSDYWMPSLMFDKKLELTFLLYPSPFWRQRF